MSANKVLFNDSEFYNCYNNFLKIKNKMEKVLEETNESYSKICQTSIWDSIASDRFISMRNQFKNNQETVNRKLDKVENYLNTVINNFYYVQSSMFK